MAVNEVYFNDNCLISLKDDTVTADDVKEGVSFHLPNGEAATGTGSSSEDQLRDVNDNSATSVDLNGVITLRDYMFYNNTALTSVYAPDLALLGIQGFAGTGLTQITDAEFPSLNTGARYAFSRCSATTVNLSKLASEGGYGLFYNCTSLTSVNLPAFTNPSTNTFQGCTALTDVNLPTLTTLGGNAFRSCTALEDISLLRVTELGSAAFYGCTALKSVQLEDVTTFGSSSKNLFYGCTALEYIEINNSTAPTLTSTYLFDSSTAGVPSTMTAFRGFFVPDAAVDDYKAATNWSTFADYIHPISEL